MKNEKKMTKRSLENFLENNDREVNFLKTREVGELTKEEKELVEFYEVAADELYVRELRNFKKGAAL